VTFVSRLGAAVLSGVVLAIALLLGAAAPASAHSQVISSSPADGQRVETSPKELTFLLSEPADLSTMVVTLTGAAGPLNVFGEPIDRGVNGVGHQTVSIPVTQTLAKGLYRVTLKVTSKFDGHTSSSEMVFGVATDVVTPAGDDGQGTTSFPDRARTVLQGVTLIGAGIAFGLLILSGLSGGRGQRTALVCALVAAAAAVCGGLLWHVGNGLVVAVAGTVGSLLLALLAGVPSVGGRWREWLAALGLVIAVAPLALVGHAAAQGGMMTVLSTLHIVTTAAWSGAVLAGAIVMVKSGKRMRLSILRRVSLVGSITFLISLITGLLLANGLVPSVAGLFGSLYGWGLVAKSLLVIPVLLLAIWARARMNRGSSASLVVEAGLLITIVAIGVLVASQPPPAAAKFQPTPSWQADTSAAALNADDLLVSVQVDPNTPGSRFLVVKVDDTRRPSPGKVVGVKASLGDKDPQPLVQGADGLWTTRVDVTEPGPTAVHVAVARDGLPVAVANSTWTVAPTPGTLEGGAALTLYVWLLIGALVALSLLGLVIEGFVLRRDNSHGDADVDGSDPRESVNV